MGITVDLLIFYGKINVGIQKGGITVISFVSDSTLKTEEFAEKIGKSLRGGTVIAFFGGLGAGKTSFTRGLARGMGIKSDVSSPTFAIVNDYGGNPPLVHFDMYKVETWDDLYSSGFFDYLDMGAVLAVEWSENIENALPESTYFIEINRIDDTTREIIIRGNNI